MLAGGVHGAAIRVVAVAQLFTALVPALPNTYFSAVAKAALAFLVPIGMVEGELPLRDAQLLILERTGHQQAAIRSVHAGHPTVRGFARSAQQGHVGEVRVRIFGHHHVVTDLSHGEARLAACLHHGELVHIIALAEHGLDEQEYRRQQDGFAMGHR